MADKPAPPLARLITGRRSARSRRLSSTFSKCPAPMHPNSHTWAGAAGPRPHLLGRSGVPSSRGGSHAPFIGSLPYSGDGLEIWCCRKGMR